MQRIVIVGTTGSGKTTLAQALAQKLDLPHIEADSYFWLPNWVERNRDEMRTLITPRLMEARWVIDGNYSFLRDLTWGQADTLIWLDYPLWVSQWRLLWRSIDRIRTQDLMWGTNRETFRAQFFSRGSLFLWALKTRPKHKRDYPVLIQQPEYAHLNVVRLKSPRETEQWLSTL
jgi:adenylate kinase family enzyme